MPGLTSVIVAHQGGWDEILLVLLPIAIFAGLLALANRRAARALDARDDEQEGQPEHQQGPDGAERFPGRSAS